MLLWLFRYGKITIPKSMGETIWTAARKPSLQGSPRALQLQKIRMEKSHKAGWKPSICYNVRTSSCWSHDNLTDASQDQRVVLSKPYIPTLCLPAPQWDEIVWGRPDRSQGQDHVGERGA